MSSYHTKNLLLLFSIPLTYNFAPVFSGLAFSVDRCSRPTEFYAYSERSCAILHAKLAAILPYAKISSFRGLQQSTSFKCVS